MVIDDEKVCAACGNPAENPVILLCGTVYCRKCILPLWRKQHRDMAGNNDCNSESAFYCPVTGTTTPLPKGAASLWGNLRLRHNIEQAQARRTTGAPSTRALVASRPTELRQADWRSPMAEPPAYGMSGSMIGSPPPSPMQAVYAQSAGSSQSGAYSSQGVPKPPSATNQVTNGPPPESPIMCYKRGNSFVPVEEEYNFRRTHLHKRLEDTDIYVNKLTQDLARMVETRDDVQAEYHAIAKDLRSRFSELKALLEMRESMLMSDLDKLRNQKSEAVRKGAADCRECIDTMQTLRESIVRLMDTEQDPNVFLAEAVVPDKALQDILNNPRNYVPEVEVGFGVALEATTAMESLQNLNLHHGSQVRFSPKKRQLPLGGSTNSQSGGVPPPPLMAGEEQRALRFTITLEQSFQVWTANGATQKLVFNAIALNAGVPPERIRVIKEEAGSVILTLEVLVTPADSHTVTNKLVSFQQRVLNKEGNLAGIPVLAMDPPSNVPSAKAPGQAASTTVGQAADAALDRILSAKSAMKSAAGSGQPGETEHVIAVDELWKPSSAAGDAREVCLLVQELRDGVVFSAHNISRKAVMVTLDVTGELNFENVAGRKTLIPAGSKNIRIGRFRPLDPSTAWNFKYDWSVDSTALEGGAARNMTKAQELKSIEDQLKEKKQLKEAAIANEQFLEAANIKKEIDALTREQGDVQGKPDDKSPEEQISDLEAKKNEKVAAEDFLAAEALKAQIVELRQTLGAQGGASAPPPGGSLPDGGLKEVYCTSLTFERDYQSWDRLKHEDTVVTQFKGRLGLTADSVDKDSVNIVSRRASMGVSNMVGGQSAGAPPAGKLILDFEVKIPSQWTSQAQGQVYRSLVGLRNEAKKKQLMFGDMLVLDLTEPGPPPPAPPPDSVPSQIGKPHASKVPGATDSIKLSWKPPDTDGGSKIIGYRIWKALGTNEDFKVIEENTGKGPDSTETVLNGLDTGVAVKFKVAAVSDTGLGAVSIET